MASGTCGEDVSWTLDDWGTLTIYGTGDMADYSETDVAPWYSYCEDEWISSIVIEEGVTSVGDYAFNDCYGIVEATIPKSVRSIGNHAFDHCYDLESITLSDGILSIGAYAFSHCYNLISITIPCSIGSIGDYAFQYSSLESIALSDGLLSIGDYAFSSCDISSITIPDSVTSIGICAFEGCYLTSIVIPGGVTSIDGSAFHACPGLSDIIVDESNTAYATMDGVLFDKTFTTLILYPAGKADSSYVIPDSVTSIGGYAFSSCKNLTSITIPDGVTSIGEFAFYYCRKLTSFTIPEGVTSIGEEAFGVCDSLTNITLPGSVTTISDWTFYYCKNLASISIPDSVTSIGEYAFCNCISLASIEIPESVTSIGGYAFDDCDSLASIEIPESVTSIGGYVFYDCDGLTSIKLPDEITSIAEGMFVSCGKLCDITIPDSVTSIGESAFSGCSRLPNITIPSSVTSIGASAFGYCDRFTDITIPAGVTSIGEKAFSHCERLTRITIPDSVVFIGAGTFSGCSKLTTITIPDAVTSIENETFRYCESLTSITIPSGITNIGEEAFCQSAIRHIILQSGTVNVNINAKATYLQQITIGNQVNTLNSGVLEAFMAGSPELNLLTFDGGNYFTYTGNDCTIGKLTLTAGAYYVDEYGVLYRLNEDGKATVWYAPEKLSCTEYTILEFIPSESDTIANYTVTAIHDHAFQDCKTLTSVTIPENVTSIGSWAFCRASNLTSVNGETSLTKVLEYWEPAGANSNTFADTALWNHGINGTYTVTSDSIGFTETTGRRITLTISEIPDELLTGQAVTSTLKIDMCTQDSTDAIRVYFQFESDEGVLDYAVKEHSFGGVMGEICRTNVPNTYYLEIPRTLAGQTLTLNLHPEYPDFTAGGSVLIWLKAIPEDQIDENKNIVLYPQVGLDKVHLATWITKRDTFPVTESAVFGNVSVKGDGTDSDVVYVADPIAYSIYMSRTGDTSNDGKDLMTSVDFVSTLILPEPFQWREGLVDAIRRGNYPPSSRGSGYGDIYDRWEVEIDGVLHSFARILTENTNNWPETSLAVDENGNIQIRWTYFNKSSTEEIPNIRAEIRIWSSMIEAKSDLLEAALRNADDTLKYSLQNNVTAVQHFTYSGDKEYSVSAVKEVSVGASDYAITKKVTSDSQEMGEANTFTIELSNDSALPYTELDYVEDCLPDYYYITPADMESMFFNDTYGKELSITIKDAVLTKEQISRKVIGTDGKEYTLTQQYMGNDTDYDIYNYNDTTLQVDSSLVTDDATISIGWAEDKTHLILRASYKNKDEEVTIEKSIGTGKACGSIQEALDSIGYLVTEPVTYTCKWNQRVQADQGLPKLYSGAVRKFYVRASAKDTFMRLTGDQPWFIIKGEKYVTQIKNYASGYATDESEKTDDVTVSNLYRDFTLDKGAYQGEEEIDGADVGDVLTYRTKVTHAGSTSYNALPLIDNMEGAQVLLVSASENTHLEAWGQDTQNKLDTLDINGDTYYLLNKPGEYKNVKVGTHLADRVVVTKTVSNLDTMIYWYLSEVNGVSKDDKPQQVEVEYLALVSPKEAGITVAGDVFKLSNEVWLNDHETHRLYDAAFVDGTILSMNKKIITNLDESELSDLSQHNPKNDIEADRSIVGAGDKVVYRLLLGSNGGKVVVNGSSMYDTLPASLNNYWSTDNVTVSYVHTEETEATIDNGDSWDIVNDPTNKNQQYLRWGEDFSATIDGTLYIYVTLTFPSESWADYGKEYGNKDVSNTFHVYQLHDEVFHSLSVTAEVLLQKGVYRTGVADAYNFDRNYYGNYEYSTYRSTPGTSSLWHYTNSTQAQGIVTYYVTLYNSGDTRVYLEPMQDVLPKGFTFRALYDDSQHINYASNDESTAYYNYSGANLVTINEEGVTYKQAYIEVSYSGRAVIFSFSNNEEWGNLCFDEELQKYYLDTGHALVFAYHCATNDYAATEDIATNTIAMPYYDYNGAGVNLNTRTTVDRKNVGSLESNNGSRTAITTGEAKLIGMQTTGVDNSKKWLSSEVTVSRGSIMPGITKLAPKPFATPQEMLTWDIKVSNSGTYDMRGYTIADEMQAPYQFVGPVSYVVYSGAEDGEYFAENEKLFVIGERTENDEKVTISYYDPPSLFNPSLEHTVDLIVNNDEYQTITSYMAISGVSDSSNKNWERVTLGIRLTRDEHGNETLFVHFNSTVDTIPAGGTAIMTLQTKYYGSNYFNMTYTNTSYITPCVEQPFDTSAVSQGNYTFYENQDSVVSEANVVVSFGYATSSEKSVAELLNTKNVAFSTGSVNAIALADAGSIFRYTLTVNNLGGNETSKAMDKLVLIDNLPQMDDHVTFDPAIPRYSDFEVDFANADGLNFAVSVNGTSLDSSKYVVEFSEKTEFDSEDWKGTGTEGWFSMSDITTLSNMRSVRVKILDENGTLIPADAVITVSFNARIDTSKGVPESSSVAWNSFGYRYSLLGDSTELEAAPQKVGVKMPSVPALVKELVDSNGDAYSAREDATFRFVIYEGEAITLPEGYAEADVFTALGEKNFTVVDLTVEAGKSASNAKKLSGLYCWRYTDGVLAQNTEEAWNWTHLSRYTIMELPLPNNSVYTFGAFDRIHPNNYTFVNNPVSDQTITCSNVRDVWEILVSKTCETTRKPLSGAVFGIYSTKESDKISDENFEALTASLRTKPEKKVESWYLMDIQTTNADGTIRWNGLTEESYYVQELQAPDGYSFEQEGKVLTRGNGNSVTIEVTNKPGYKLPETGGPGTKLLTTAGLLLMMTALVLLFKRRWGGAIIG